MQVVRNALVILLLAGVGYAVYTYVNKPGQTPPPGADLETPDLTVNVGGASALDPGKMASSPATPRIAGAPLDEAPAFSASPLPKVAMEPARESPALPAAPPRFEPRAEVRSAVDATYDSNREPARGTGGANAPVSIETPPRAGHDAVGAAGTFKDSWQQAQQLLATGKLVDAHAQLTAWYGDPSLTPDQDVQLVTLLSQLAGTVVYSNTDHLLDPAYAVGPNDTLEEIAQKHRVPWQLLAKINGISDPKSIRAGDRLKVVKGPFHAVVNLGRKEIALVVRGHYAGRFPIVRTGVDAGTLPSASTGLVVKEKMNARGEHYLGVEDATSKAIIGIYTEEGPAGGLKMPAESSIVLGARDAEELYDILTSQESTVAITP